MAARRLLLPPFVPPDVLRGRLPAFGLLLFSRIQQVPAVLAAPIGRQESHALFGLSQSNALLRLESGESLKAGQTIAVQVFD